MFDDFTKYRILIPFFREPTTKHQLRELSRKTEVSTPSVKKYIEELLDEDLIEKVDEGVYQGYRASLNQKFKLYKKLDTVRNLHETGLVEELEKEFRPNSIVLFGSAAEGEDTEDSDIDIMVVAEGKNFETSKYKDFFNREINIQFMSEEELSSNKEFANSIANGIVLNGFLKVKK